MKRSNLESKVPVKKGISPNNIPWIAIVGNPNSGKTAIFNRLTGSHHKVGNYPGVTVEKKTGWLRGQNIQVRDLPGSYSLNANSLDEKIVVDTVQQWRLPEHRPQAVVVVIDATNLTRNLYLTLQILEWNIPTIVVLNMMDEVRKRDIKIEVEKLQEELHAYKVIPASAKTGEGIQEIINAIRGLPYYQNGEAVKPRLFIDKEKKSILKSLTEYLKNHPQNYFPSPLTDSVRLVANDQSFEYIKQLLEPEEIKQIQNLIQQARVEFGQREISFPTLESHARYAFIDNILAKCFSEENLEQKSFSERIDAFLSHPVAGPIVLILILGFIFNSIFSWAEYPMGWIETGVSWLSVQARMLLPDGVLKNLIVDGIIAGVGNVIVFFPQIVLLIFFLALLEDSGYMARMAFILDRLMSKFGLHGKAVLPMLSGFACAIPAIMASRTIENWRDRLLTIMLIPLMSCSARLPVYILLISAFIPHQTIWGFLQLEALVLMGMYFLGFFTAIMIALFIKKFIPERRTNPFIMELPPYRKPMFSSIWWRVYNSGKLFLVNAGSIILAISIVLWFLASYPKPEASRNLTPKEKVEQSYAGQIGHLLEPVIQPLGFDWKIGVGLIASFAAREVLVSTFATIYNIEQADEDNVVPLVEALRKDRYPDGRPVFTVLVAVSLLVYFVYAAQCMATFAIIKRETNSWRWPIVMVVYMTVLAYTASLIVFQSGTLLGLG